MRIFNEFQYQVSTPDESQTLICHFSTQSPSHSLINQSHLNCFYSKPERTLIVFLSLLFNYNFLEWVFTCVHFTQCLLSTLKKSKLISIFILLNDSCIAHYSRERGKMCEEMWRKKTNGENVREWKLFSREYWVYKFPFFHFNNFYLADKSSTLIEEI